MEDDSVHYTSGHSRCPDYMLTVDADRGEIICRGCGTVITDRLPDERYGGQLGTASVPDGDPATLLTMYDRGLYTMMGDKPNLGKFDRLQKWDKRTKSTAKTRNLGVAFTLLHSIKSKLAIPENVTEKAAYYYRKALEKKLIKNKGTAPMLLACLYAACRQTNTPRSLGDLSTAGNIKKTRLSRAIRLVVRGMDLQLDQYDISSFVTRMANNINFKERTKRDALEIIRSLGGTNVVGGKNPVAIATAALYVSAILNEEDVTQSLMASASGVSTVTIRNISDLIRRELDC